MTNLSKAPVEAWTEPDIFYRSECSICRIEINYRTKEPYYSQQAHVHLQKDAICAGSKAPLLWFRITKEQINEDDEQHRPTQGEEKITMIDTAAKRAVRDELQFFGECHPYLGMLRDRIYAITPDVSAVQINDALIEMERDGEVERYQSFDKQLWKLKRK